MMTALRKPSSPDSEVRQAFDVERVRRDFPILGRDMNGKPLVYLDSAASAQKPRSVINAMAQFYEQGYANIHRGIYTLSQEATDAYERVRDTVRGFINARSRKEIVFVRGATEAINLVAASYGRAFLQAGDEVLITTLEHHSNIVPWQMLGDAIGTVLKVVPISDSGDIHSDAFEAMLGPKTRFVAIAHVSNALGSVIPVQGMIQAAHRRGIPVLVDGAQAVPHMRVDVQALDCDFYVFSGHKLFGPTGVGVLYGREEFLEKMPPYQGGGDMIRSVSFEKTLYNTVPFKFEAGTPDIAAVIGLGAAIDYLTRLDWNGAMAHEHALLAQAKALLKDVPQLRLIGPTETGETVGLVSFVIEDIHPHDIGTILDYHGIAIRAGHHCAQPLMQRLGIAATARASFAFYNSADEVRALARCLHTAVEVFSK